MDKWMEALAESLRNLGYDATADGDSVKVDEVRFWGDRYRWKTMHMFLGRRYVTNGPVLGAVLAVIQELPEAQERDRQYRRRLEGGTAAQMLKQECRWACGRVSTEYAFGHYELTFRSRDMMLMREAIRRLNELAAVEPGNEEIMADWADEQGMEVWAEELRKAVRP